MLVSVLVPVYNERKTLPVLLERVLAVPIDLEVVVVDDGSTDGTREWLREFRSRKSSVIFHEGNRGKGAAVVTALRRAKGDIVLIQDADLEYNPADYPRLVRPIADGECDVVYGVRSWPADAGAFPRLGNRLLTVVANVLYGAHLSDLETGYKVFRREAVEASWLQSPRFGFDPEITAFFLRRRLRFREVPIGYARRPQRSGKKLRWTDGLVVLLTLAVCRVRRLPGGREGRGEGVDG